MYKGINIRQHNKNQLHQAQQFLIKNDPHRPPTITATRISIEDQQSEDGDSNMWAELQRNARIAKQNKIKNQTHSTSMNYDRANNQNNLHHAMQNQVQDNQREGAGVFQFNQCEGNYQSIQIKTSKERLNNYLSQNMRSFEEEGTDDEFEANSVEPTLNTRPSKKLAKEKSKVERKKGKKKDQDKFEKQDHYVVENVIEARDPTLFTVDKLKVEAPLTRNYRMGDKEEWQRNRAIEDYKLQFVLRKFNKIKDYRNNQKAIIKCSLLGNDVFVCMPTGGGKSLTFQAMTFIEKGVYLCILPLVSLIIDQEQQAKKLGIQAYSLTGSKQIQDNKMIYQTLLHYESGQDSIVIFCTPEKINKSPQFFGVLQQVYEKKYLVKIVIDEVHCVSTWGKQFRQDYQNLSSLKENFPQTPILGLTATVTQVIKQDIIKRLRIDNCFYFQSSFNRPNLHYQVREKNKDILNNIVKIVGEHQQCSGIIYCVSRKDCQEMCSQLQSKRYKVAFYHANISEPEKREIQSQWMEDKIQIIIATIAFGMGINKPDVRFVIHHSLSKSLENYYQESGRAGRDGEQAKCILFYRRADKISLQSLIMKNQISKDENKNFCMRQLSNMIKYCEDRYTCRRKFQLDYLGEKNFDPTQCNKTCDNCNRGLNYIEVQCINQAKCLIMFMMQIERAKQNVNQNQIISICKGSGEKKFQYKLQQIERAVDLNEIRQMLGKWSKINIDELILELCSCEVLYQKIITTTFKNNTVSNFYIKVNFALANKFLNKVQTLPMKRSVGKKNSKLENISNDLSDFELDFSEEAGEKSEGDQCSLKNYAFSGST